MYRVRDGTALKCPSRLLSPPMKLHNVYKRTGFFLSVKSKILLAGLIVLVAIGIASFIFIASTNLYYSDTSSSDGNSTLPLQNGTGSNESGSSGGTETSGKITSEQLAQHSSAGDCWVVYKNKVYDLTSWLPVHPGGSGRISPYCGNTGFENAFERRHGTSQVATFMRVATYEGDLA